MALSILGQIGEDVRTCTRCGLHATRTNAVPGEGSERAELLIIGEGPGANEDAQGRPFVGAAGKILDGMLASIQMDRAGVFITNVVKCRPPGNRDPLPEEKAACRPYLEQQLELLQPLLTVLLGRHALESLIPGQSISRVHGHAMRFRGRVYFPVYHPAATIYRRELLTDLARDFQKIPLLLARLRQLHDGRAGGASAAPHEATHVHEPTPPNPADPGAPPLFDLPPQRP